MGVIKYYQGIEFYSNNEYTVCYGYYLELLISQNFCRIGVLAFLCYEGTAVFIKYIHTQSDPLLLYVVFILYCHPFITK